MQAFCRDARRDPNVKKAKYLKSGENYAAQGKQQEAIIQYSNAIKIDKNYAAAHYDLAKAYMKLGAFAGGYQELQRTVALDPKNIQAKLDLGSLLLAAKQYPRSKEQANAVLALQPNNADAFALLSSVALAQGDHAEALTQIQKALAIDPNRSNFHAALALIQSRRPSPASKRQRLSCRRPSPSIPRTRWRISSSPASWRRRATCRVRVSRPPRPSISNRRTSARVSPSSASNSVPATRRPPKPRSCQGTELLSDTTQGAELLWDYYARTGQVDQAASAYANLVAKHPTSVPLKVTYAHILIQQKNYAEATRVSDDLMKSNSSDPQVAVLNGMLLLHAGKVNDAFIALQKAEKNSPDNVPVKLWFAQAAQAKGDLSDAEQNFQAAAQQGSQQPGCSPRPGQRSQSAGRLQPAHAGCHHHPRAQS